ncbi:MAG TPA: ATP-binding cassette domain-containing protein [Rhizomicrobium sp.]|jgi:capsular polysaccharide transport system ATP-binding protein|nr:ATP-binding cassette domain-containing protein [Rhizomicrobium sp.]
MSVDLQNITMRFAGGRQTLFENLNLRVEAGERVGIAGHPKTGKSTLLRLICGTEYNYEGRIDRDLRVSWPTTFGDYLVMSSTLATNIRFIGRLCGVNNDDFVRKVGEIAGVTEFLNEELGNCPRFVRPQLQFAITIAVEFDIYLFDDTITGGDKDFKEKALGLVRTLDPSRGIVFASSNFKEISSCCDTIYILDKGHVARYENLKEAEKYFKSIGQQTAEKVAVQREMVERPPQEDFTSVLGI